jgi:hypothetical protein
MNPSVDSGQSTQLGDFRTPNRRLCNFDHIFNNDAGNVGSRRIDVECNDEVKLVTCNRFHPIGPDATPVRSENDVLTIRLELQRIPEKHAHVSLNKVVFDGGIADRHFVSCERFERGFRICVFCI